MGLTERRSIRRVRIAVVLAVLGLLGVLGSSASGQTVRAGNLIVNVEGGFTPHRLPRKTPASITFSARSTIATANDAHLPNLDFVTLEFDKHTGLHTKGLATCPPARLENTLTSQAKQLCPDAIIGSGQAGAEIAFPEQEPFFAKAPMVIFNGPPKNGHPIFIFHVYAFVPLPTTFVNTAEIGKASGLYGTSVHIEIPEIVAGQGGLSFAELSLHKKWSYRGKERTLLYGTCPTGHFFVHGALTFKGGSKVSGKVVSSCSPTS
jgi:hypothetical protein